MDAGFSLLIVLVAVFCSGMCFLLGMMMASPTPKLNLQLESHFAMLAAIDKNVSELCDHLGVPDADEDES